MDNPEVQTGFVTQADLKLLRDQVDQLQVILTEPRKPWYLEGSTLTSALAVLVALISFFISSYQGDQKELREKREEFRSVLEKLVSMSEEVDRLRSADFDTQEVSRRLDYLHDSKDLYRSSAEMLAQDLGPNVLFAEYLIMGDQFQEDNNHRKATEYYEKALAPLIKMKTWKTDADLVEQNRAYRRLARLQNSLLLKNVAKMNYYFDLAIQAAKGEGNDLMRFTAGATYEDWAEGERRLKNYKESLVKLELAEQEFLKMSDDDQNKHRSLDRVKLQTGYTLLSMADAEINRGNHKSSWEKLAQAEQVFLKISDYIDNKKQKALAELRRLRKLASPWTSASPPTLGPAPLWRSPLLDDAIKNLGREAPSSRSSGTQP